MAGGPAKVASMVERCHWWWVPRRPASKALEVGNETSDFDRSAAAYSNICFGVLHFLMPYPFSSALLCTPRLQLWL
ncbi:unnamed protein product [Urochloa humidicola]